MLKKDIIKKLSIGLTAAMIISGSTISFADVSTSSETSEITDSSEITDPIEKSINISANYTTDNNIYTIVFTATENLDEIKNLNFKVSVTGEDGIIKTASFADALKNGDYALSITGGDKIATFTKGAETVAIKNKATLCTVVVEAASAPTAESIAFTDFTAINADGVAINYTPLLTVSGDLLLPELTEKEQAVYDALISLPSLDSLSFYTDETKLTLIDTAALAENIEEISTAYTELSSTEKENIDNTLAFYNYSIEHLSALKTLTSDMDKVADVMQVALKLNSIQEDLLSYIFIPNIYTNIIAENIDEEALSFEADSVLKTEYEQAKTDITAKKSAIDELYAEIGTTDAGYEQKIEILENQLAIIQTLSTDKYYDEYLEDLIEQAENLKTEIASYPVESTREAFTEDIEEFISKIKLIQSGVSTMPSVTLDSKITRGSSYNIKLTRKANAAIDAKVKILVYDEEDLDSVIDQKELTFNARETSLSSKLFALKSIYPKNGTVLIKIYYIVEDAEFCIESKSLECYERKVDTSSSTSSSNSSSTRYPSSSQTGGTRYPDPDDEEKTPTAPKPVEKELFNDIQNYAWAEEAIEGLYYAGIINGMEEGVFNPAGSVTREQFCKMVVQLFGVLQNDTKTNFIDVDPSAWYAPYITSSINAGYVQGQSDEYFGIGESIMRQDMATILYRALGSQNSSAVLDFTDNDEIAPYAEDAISELVGLGVISGYEDGSFKPRGTATRAEAAKVIWGIYKILND